MKRVLLILVLLAAAALLFADGETAGVRTGYRNMFQLALQEQIQTAVENRLTAQLRLGSEQEEPLALDAREASSRWQARSGDGDCNCDGDPDRDRTQLRDGTGDGVPDQKQTGKS